MLEGKPPYDRGSALATLTAVMTEELPAPENAGPLRPVIEGLLEKDPAERLDASTTRSMLKRIVAEATARAESTTRLSLPPPSRPGPSGHRLTRRRKSDRPTPGASPTAPVTSAKPSVPGLSTVRVGSQLPAAEPDGGSAADPLPAQTGVWSRSGTLGITSRWSRRRRLLLTVLLLAVVLVLAGGIWLAFGSSGSTAGKGAKAAAAPSTSGSAPGAVSAASATGAVSPASSPAAPTSAAPSSAAPTSAAPSSPAGSSPAGSTPAPGNAAPSSAAASSPAPSGSPGAAVPTGFYQYTDSSGFTIQLPNGLNLDAGSSKDGSHVFRGDGITLQIDWTTTPGASAVAAWQTEEQSVAPTLTGYQRIQLQALTGWRWSNAADWEWTFGSGTRQHSLNRGFVLDNRKYGYAIYWTTSDSDWTTPAIIQARDIGFQSFQPAP